MTRQSPTPSAPKSRPKTGQAPDAALTRDNLVGAGWMVTAMAAFAVEDALVKGATQMLPTAQILLIFGLGGALVFALLARLKGERLLTAQALSRPMRVRVLFEVSGRLFYLLALAMMPLSTVTVILQATPIVVVAAAALIFGERVGPRRWCAIALGMAGVLVILQPGADSFSAASLLALAGMVGFAGRDLASRAAPATLGTNVLGFYGFAAIVVAGLIYWGWTGAALVMPLAPDAVRLALAVASGVFAYSCLMKAMRRGQVSAVTPFRYTRLLFGIALGLAFFGERLAPSMMLGSAMIVMAGLFILWRNPPRART